MAYNNYYPATYQQFPYMAQNGPYSSDFQQGQTNIQRPQAGAVNGIIWVQGEAGAKAYPVAPNNTVQLWDAESQTIYLKSADISGMPTMKVLEYTIRDETTAGNALRKDLSAYVTREEFEQKLGELMKKVSADE